MNERIKEIELRCYVTLTKNAGLNGRTSITSTVFDKEKFAELIVKECIKQARLEEERFYGLGESDLALCMEHFQEVLKQHFGVE